MSTSIQSLWQHQEPPFRKMSPDQVRRRADEALAADRKYRFTGLVTSALVVASFALFFFASQNAMGRIGGAVGMGAGVSMAYRAYRLVATHPLLASAFGIDAYRRILQREQKALTICWQTMLLIQLGVALNLLGFYREIPDLPRHALHPARQAAAGLAMIVPVIIVAMLTRAKAHAYGRRAQELDLLADESTGRPLKLLD